MRLAIVGDGKMGRTLAALAEERGHVVHAIIGRAENAGGGALTKARLAGVDVALEFTRPDVAVANLERLIEAGVPTVTGTTGWSAELPRIAKLVESKRGALLHAANFSVGVHLFLRAARDLAARFAGRPEFDAFITGGAPRGESGCAVRHRARVARAGARGGSGAGVPHYLYPCRGGPWNPRADLRRRRRDDRAQPRGAEPPQLRGGGAWPPLSGCRAARVCSTSRRCCSEEPSDAPPGLRHRAGHPLHRYW